MCPLGASVSAGPVPGGVLLSLSVCVSVRCLSFCWTSTRRRVTVSLSVCVRQVPQFLLDQYQAACYRVCLPVCPSGASVSAGPVPGGVLLYLSVCLCVRQVPQFLLDQYQAVYYCLCLSVCPSGTSVSAGPVPGGVLLSLSVCVSVRYLSFCWTSTRRCITVSVCLCVRQVPQFLLDQYQAVYYCLCLSVCPSGASVSAGPVPGGVLLSLSVCVSVRCLSFCWTSTRRRVTVSVCLCVR